MTPDDRSQFHCAFLGSRLLALGSLQDVTQAASAANGAPEALLLFDGEGRQIEPDLRAGASAAPTSTPAPTPAPVRSRGRPQLGVVAREVTLLPRHWEWLGAQPGGASVTLRRLVEEARRGAGGAGSARAARERAYRFLNAIAGNLPGYEEALRALFAGDGERFAALAAEWPQDIRQHAQLLATGAFDGKQDKP